MNRTQGGGYDDLPLVSVVVATRDRPRFLSIALECYRRQTYPHRELVVVDTGDVAPVDLAAVDASGGRVLRVAPGTPLGTKLNLGLEATSGPFCQKIDEDGWYGADFLETMISAVLTSWRVACRPVLAYLAPFLFFDLPRWEVWRPVEAHGSAGTLLFQRENWRQRPFQLIAGNEDVQFVRDQLALGATGLAIRGLETYLAVRHAAAETERRPNWSDPADQSVEGSVRVQPSYGLGVEAIVPDWGLQIYRQIHRETAAAAGDRSRP